MIKKRNFISVSLIIMFSLMFFMVSNFSITAASVDSTNFIENAGFESGSLTPWQDWSAGQYSVVNGISHTGSYSLKLAGINKHSSSLYQGDYTLEPNTVYKLSVFTKSPDPNSHVWLRVYTNDWSTLLAEISTSTSKDWTKTEVKFNSGTKTTVFVIISDMSTTTNYYDDLAFEKYDPSSTSEPTNVPTATPIPSTSVPTVTPTPAPSVTATPTPLTIAVSDISISQKTLSMKVSEIFKLDATVIPINASENSVSWKSSNTKVATVSSAGKVKALSPGLTVITVKSVDGSYAKTCKVTVIQSVKSLKLNKTNLTLKVAKTIKLIATISPSNASNKKVVWKTTNSKIASVSSNGTVKGIKKGIVYVTATSVDDKKSAKCKVLIK